jgi:Protein of unknown function (DUF3015)
MKKVFICSVIFAVLIAGTAFAAGTARENTGCGLGTMLWENKADDSSISQALQATTNGTFGSQTFGISTGTSECKQPTRFVKNEKVNQFVAHNIDNIAKDIAMGKGESLDTLAELMEVSADKRPAFYSKLQANFSRIFTSEKVEAADVIDNILSMSTQS